MEINLRTIKIYNKTEWTHIIPIGDIHMGNVGCDVEKLKELVAWIKEKDNVYWIGMGDFFDCINYTDKRFDPHTIAPEFRDALDNLIPMQMHKVSEILSPIKDKCLGLHEGNHERKIRLKYHYNPIYEIWKSFNIPAIPILKDAAITRLKFIYQCDAKKKPSYTYDIFSVHGNVGGRKGGAKLNRLEDMCANFNADIYLMAHSHIKLTESKSMLYVDAKLNLKRTKKVLAVTGCFLNGYTKGFGGYCEQWMLSPTMTGVVKISLRPIQRDLHVSE